MTLLASRWSELAQLPHVNLGNFPTPVERLAEVSKAAGCDVWIKRDDLTGAAYGGNKVRKLEYLLADARARNADTIVTIGAVGSHHVLATTTYGKSLGFDVHAFVGPQPYSEHALESAQCDLALGGVLHPVRTYAVLPAAMGVLRAKHFFEKRSVYSIPPGGSNAVGAIGYVEAGLELAEQITRRELPEPAAIYVALGTGSTVAGLAIGLAAAGLTTKVVGVRVAMAVAANKRRLGALMRETVALLRGFDSRFPDVAKSALSHVSVETRQFGKGYGVATEEGESAKTLAAHDGIELETTYTAKTLAALLKDAATSPGGGTRLYYHTLSSSDLSGLLARAPALPAAVASLARE